MFSKDNTIEKIDPEVWASIQRESQRQEEQIELIASENYTSPAVLQAQGSILTNKYAEGYPEKDTTAAVNTLTKLRHWLKNALRSFFCEPCGVEMAVNVQPHSGAQANMGVFLHCLILATPSWECLWQKAATSPTA